MAYKISDECIKCGSCADTCPSEAISEGDATYVIDAENVFLAVPARRHAP